MGCKPRRSTPFIATWPSRARAHGYVTLLSTTSSAPTPSSAICGATSRTQDLARNAQGGHRLAIQQPGVDPQRVGLLGLSLGSFPLVSVAPNEERVGCVVEYFGGMLPNVADNLRRMPPTLILHGEKDPLVPVEQAQPARTSVQRQENHLRHQALPRTGPRLLRNPTPRTPNRALSPSSQVSQDERRETLTPNSGMLQNLSQYCITPCIRKFLGTRTVAVVRRFSRSRFVGGISERKKEIKRRRHRRKKLTHFAAKLKKATASEKVVITEKIRNLTRGAEVILANWGLSERGCSGLPTLAVSDCVDRAGRCCKRSKSTGRRGRGRLSFTQAPVGEDDFRARVRLRIFSVMTTFSEAVAFLSLAAKCVNFLRRCRRRLISFSVR